MASFIRESQVLRGVVDQLKTYVPISLGFSRPISETLPSANANNNNIEREPLLNNQNSDDQLTTANTQAVLSCGCNSRDVCTHTLSVSFSVKNIFIKAINLLFNFTKVPVTLFTLATYILIIGLSIYFNTNSNYLSTNSSFNSSLAPFESQFDILVNNLTNSNNLFDFILNRYSSQIQTKANPISISTLNYHDILSVNLLLNQSSNPIDIFYYESPTLIVSVGLKSSQGSIITFTNSYSSDQISIVTPQLLSTAIMISTIDELIQSSSIPHQFIFAFSLDSVSSYGSARLFLTNFKDPIKFFFTFELFSLNGFPSLVRASSNSVANFFSSAKLSYYLPLYNYFTQLHNLYFSSMNAYDAFVASSIPGMSLGLISLSKIYSSYNPVSGWALREAFYSTISGLSLSQISTKKLQDNNTQDLSISIWNTQFSISTETITSIIISLLTFCPLSLFFLLYIANRRSKLSQLKKGWFRLPISLTISIAGLIVSLIILKYVNNNVWYAYPFVFASFGIGFLATNYVILRIFHIIRPVKEIRVISILQLFTILWIALIILVSLSSSFLFTTLFWIIILYCCFYLASLFDLIRILYSTTEYTIERPFSIAGTNDLEESTPLLSNDIEDNEIFSIFSDDNETNNHEVISNSETVTAEAARDVETVVHNLSHRNRRRPRSIWYRFFFTVRNFFKINERNYKDKSWIFDFLLIVPISLILISDNGIKSILISSSTLVYGDATTFLLYFVIALYSVAVIYPILFLTHKLMFRIILLLVLIATVLYLFALFIFPFNSSSQLPILYIGSCFVPSQSINKEFIGLSPYTTKLTTNYTNVTCTETFNNLESCIYTSQNSNCNESVMSVTPYYGQGLNKRYMDKQIVLQEPFWKMSTTAGKKTEVLTIQTFPTLNLNVTFLTNGNKVSQISLLNGTQYYEYNYLPGFQTFSIYKVNPTSTFQIKLEYSSEVQIEILFVAKYSYKETFLATDFEDDVNVLPSWAYYTTDNDYNFLISNTFTLT